MERRRPLVARHAERRKLLEALASDQPELIGVYGRRRVGKTFLVRSIYEAHLVFELVGIHEADLSTQLASFSAALEAASKSPAPLAPPPDWHTAFRQLSAFLERRLEKHDATPVVFFDEVPWLASRRSGFLQAFEHFWNSWASRQPRVTVVLCGSAASWMLEHVVSERGGLHNRVTRRIRVEPFTLADTEELLETRGLELGRAQIVELYMALGGVPHYLAQVQRGDSAAQSIDRLCFARDGLLRDEFSNLFASLFEQAKRHESVVRALATRRSGLSRTELLDAAKLDTGGSASAVLEELEQSGFITQIPRFGKKVRDGVYWLADEFSLFSLKWLGGRLRTVAGDGEWMRRQGTPAWRAWAGLAFEAVCLKHVRQLKRALGIEGVETAEASWALRPDAHHRDGAQIDLVIDRADRCMNLCEMKFSEAEFSIDKAYARELEHKRNAFREATGTSKTLFLTMVTSNGLRDSPHARQLIAKTVTVDALFSRGP